MSSFLHIILDKCVLEKYIKSLKKEVILMRVSEKIKKRIKKIPMGTTFTYNDLLIEMSEYTAAAKVLERLISEGILKRSSNGVFYKPEITVFGELRPPEEELLKPYLFENGQRIAYITGTSLYNKMWLTTQIPKVIKIACKNKRITASIKGIEVKSVKSYVDVNNDNYYLLEVLDALKDFKTIPDIDEKAGLAILKNRIKSFSEKEISNLVKYVLLYPPRTRAFLGAILELLGEIKYLEKLRSSLNPFSSYNFGMVSRLLSTAANWSIR